MSPLIPTLVLLLAAAVTATTSSEWAKYKQLHERFYSKEEDAARMKIWKANVEIVEKHNSGNNSYTMAINKFSDWTEEEFNKFLGYQPRQEKYNAKTFQKKMITDVVNYVQEGKVTPVKDQGDSCASGWAFSATGAMEGLLKKDTGNLISMSTQQLIDCSAGDCSGGQLTDAWQHAMQTGYMQHVETYKYTGETGPCQFDPSRVGANVNVKGYLRVSPYEFHIEGALLEAGYPISAVIHASASFRNYRSGIYDEIDCNMGRLNHAVLIVGFDKSGSVPYWIVKNSFGTDWGENGYIKMKMDINICSITSSVYFPYSSAWNSASSLIISVPLLTFSYFIQTLIVH